MGKTRGGKKRGQTRAKRKSARKPRRKPARKTAAKKRRFARRWRVLGCFTLAGLVGLAVYAFLLDRQIRTQFEGRRWQVPARVYAQPLELYPGRAFGPKELKTQLEALGYRRASAPAPGQFVVTGDGLAFATRAFQFWDGEQASGGVRVAFRGRRIASLTTSDGEPLPIVRLDPALIGSIIPTSGEDRIVLEAAGVPSLLTQALIAVEDQDFYAHHGLDFSAIARAAWANLRAGGVRQGGSTLTQQLVKSYFLDNRRTFGRKAREALMAVLLDARYAKTELLHGYVNEVYLGQDGARAVHGFGLASQFYFGRPLAEIDAHQIALLVAIVRGPSLYDPRRRPAKARARRDLVLDLLEDRQVLSPAAVADAKVRELDVTNTPTRASNRFPAFLDVVRSQLARDYRREDLAANGLKVFTTLDRAVQMRAEEICTAELAALEKERGMPAGRLEVGAVISDPGNGELLAVVGGRRAGYAGYNRALSTRRPIGSLIKPVVYLTALAERDYHLASTVPDTPIELTLANGQLWRPENLAASYAGEMPLYRALADSINLPAVHVGLDVGPKRVARQLRRLGVEREVEAYPSLLLGAVDLSPLEVASVYGTLAAGGFRTPPRALRAVVDEHGEPLSRYGLTVAPVASAGAVGQINAALVTAVTNGTGRRVAAFLPASLTVAGKTGSSNDLRDGWFAGFSADRLAVVWVGRDNNEPMGLSGSQSALPIWGSLMSEFARQPFAAAVADDLVVVELDYATGALASARCTQTVLLPLPPDAAPPTLAGCEPDASNAAPLSGIKKWLRDRFGD